MTFAIKRGWSRKRFGFDACDSHHRGWLYLAATMFGVSFILFDVEF